MARKAKKKPAGKRAAAPANGRSRPVAALLFLVFAVMLLVAVWTFDLDQSRHITSEADPGKNLVGLFGAESAFWLFFSIGMATWVLPVYLFWIGVRFLLAQGRGKRTATGIASLVALICSAALLAMFESAEMATAQGGLFEHQLPQGLGGVAGAFVATHLTGPVGGFGAFLFLFAGFMIGTVVIFTDNLGRLFEFFGESWRNFRERRAEARTERAELKQQRASERKNERKMRRKEQRLEKERARKQRAAGKTAPAKAGKAAAASKGTRFLEPEPALAEAEAGRKPSLLSRAPTPPPGMAAADRKAGNKAPASSAPFAKPMLDEPEPAVASGDDGRPKVRLDPESIKIISGEKTEKAVAAIPERRGSYVFPNINLLAASEDDADQPPPEDHRGTMESLVRTLDEFGVKVIPDEIHTGPVITRYEVKPAPGIRVEKIVNLDKNIALGLRAMSVRILAPVPGKGTVGIEVPNRHAQAVRMRDIVESRAWADSKAEIPVVLGKDVTGKPIVADLTKMPHVLIAGSTGSGKTVCINAVIASLLYRYGPEDLRFIMVDPKVVEMQVYNALPHMLIPVVTEPKKVPGALKWLIAEMDRRYQVFARAGVRNIAGFNAKLLKDKAEQAKAAEMDATMTPEERAAMANASVPRDDDVLEVPDKKMPYIVCVIDELADLMMVAPADIETGIARLAQLARAAGIHLILATQRPSVNVITGVIKANLPSRISFKVASKVDSRTILDGGGAESLIGKGDMLFIPPGASSLVRAQGAFVSDEEINAIVDFLKDHNDPPTFAEEVQQQIDSGDDDGAIDSGDDDGDDLLAEAINVLRSTKRASTSMLQRRLRIGYNRAARLMEALEDRGIVGPENGSSPREILVDLDTE